MKIFTKFPRETKALAKKIIKNILHSGQKGGLETAVVIGLSGELGTGKTVFAKGLAEFFGIKKIVSPTFVFIKKYNILKSEKSKLRYFYHVDCYRLKNQQDLAGLGLKEILKNPKNIVLVEWADKIMKILPKNMTWLEFKHKGKKERIINYQ